MKPLLFLLLAVVTSATPAVRPIKWSDVPRVLSTWQAVNPSGTSAWATTSSMLPGIKPSDLLLAEEYVGQPLLGEVAVYDWGTGRNTIQDVSHEVISVTRFKFLSKGTNNAHNDGWQDNRRVKWVVVAILRPEY